jgi:hypothetical protein
MFAHITKIAGGYLLTITKTPAFTDGACVHVPSKKKAREMAARFNATPWNF